MDRLGHLSHMIAVSGFVASGIAMALRPRPLPGPDAFDMSGELWLSLDLDSLKQHIPTALQNFYIRPDNPLMWALLVTLWVLLLLDAVGQWRDPSDAEAARLAVWPPLTLALVAGALWPWLADISSLATGLAALVMVSAGLIAALRAGPQHRPSVGFFAGWSTASGCAVLAGMATEPLGMGLSETAIIATLPAAALGMATQIRLGRSFAYSAAMVWTFSALAISTISVQPMTAIAAVLGISAMAAVLIRAAS